MVAVSGPRRHFGLPGRRGCFRSRSEPRRVRASRSTRRQSTPQRVAAGVCARMQPPAGRLSHASPNRRDGGQPDARECAPASARDEAGGRETRTRSMATSSPAAPAPYFYGSASIRRLSRAALAACVLCVACPAAEQGVPGRPRNRPRRNAARASLRLVNPRRQEKARAVSRMPRRKAHSPPREGPGVARPERRCPDRSRRPVHGRLACGGGPSGCRGGAATRRHRARTTYGLGCAPYHRRLATRPP